MKRYDIFPGGAFNQPTLRANSNGSWVKYENVKYLEEELTKLKEVNEGLENRFKFLAESGIRLRKENIELKELKQEMLEVLQSADYVLSRRGLKGDCIFNEVADKIISILAKAEGES